jgi:DNA-binding Lrp family transcriptional regulator
MIKDILKILESNARSTTKQIAAITNIPSPKVAKLIKQAEKDRIILKYKAVINWEKLGDEQVWAWIEVKVTPEPDVGFDSIAEHIYRFPQVHSAYLASGTYDLVILVTGKTVHEVADFVSQKIAPIKGVQETITHFMLKRYKEDGEILEGEEEIKRQPVTL